MAKAWNQVFSFIQNNVCAFYVVFKLFCILLLVLLKVLRANGSFTLPTFSDFSNWFSGPNQTNKQTNRQSHNSQPTIQKRKYLPLCTEIKPRQQLNGSQERFAINSGTLQFWRKPNTSAQTALCENFRASLCAASQYDGLYSVSRDNQTVSRVRANCTNRTPVRTTVRGPPFQTSWHVTASTDSGRLTIWSQGTERLYMWCAVWQGSHILCGRLLSALLGCW